MNVIEEIRLIFCDVGNNNNKTWEGRLFDNGDVETRWGRVGYTLDSKLFPNAGHIFLDKKKKEKLKKGYTELKTVGQGVGASVKHVDTSDLHSIATKQIKTNKPELQKLIERLVKANIHRITSSTQITYNDTTGLFSTPLGVVELSAITEARNLLGNINSLVVAGDYSTNLKNLVNQYLRLIPTNASMKLDVKKLFPDNAAVQAQNSILDSLEASYAALQSKPKTNKNNKAATEEEVFNVELDLLDESKEIDRISKWFYSSNHATHGYSNVKIINFYKVKIKNNWDNFNEKLGNLREVFHSTGEGNLLSILKTGLHLSPPSTVAIAGALFGRGHYGAIDSSKSLQYTFGRFAGKAGQSGWSFVCDFALGNTYYIKSYGGNKPSGYDSIWAKKENTGLRFDELIVPTNEQCRLKYLLEVK